MSKLTLKTWVSPLLAVFFVAVGTSGTLMLLDLAPDALEELHEWLGLGFVVVAALHLVLNGRAFLSYLRSTPAIVALAAGVIVCGTVIAVGGEGDHENDEKAADGTGSGHSEKGVRRHHEADD